jgi:hypothetical protein
MFAVLTMEPDMSLGQWLLVTLTAGAEARCSHRLGGRGGPHGKRHLYLLRPPEMDPRIALGYAASIYAHSAKRHGDAHTDRLIRSFSWRLTRLLTRASAG